MSTSDIDRGQARILLERGVLDLGALQQVMALPGSGDLCQKLVAAGSINATLAAEVRAAAGLRTPTAPVSPTEVDSRGGSELMSLVDGPTRAMSSAPLLTTTSASRASSRLDLARSYERAAREDPLIAPHAESAFERLGVLGEGGMGVVYRVRDLRLGREAALKALRGEESNPATAARFMREARIMARLDHPSIPPIHEAGVRADGEHYLLMKIIQGETLRETLSRAGPEDRPALLEVLLKVGEAVAYAHSKGILHRDLKPSNIMVGAFGEVMVMDWGIARDLAEPDDLPAPALAPQGSTRLEDNLTHTGSVLGTPGYMAPEQANGEEATARSDVFALGAMLTEALTGQRAVEGRGSVQRIKATLEGRVRRPRQIDRRAPRELDALAARALALDPAERLAGAALFGRELRSYLRGEELTIVRYGPLARALRFARRHPRSLSLALVLVLFAALSLVAWRDAAQARRARARLEGAFSALARAQSRARRGAPEDEVAADIDAALSFGESAYPLQLAAAEVLAGGRYFQRAEGLLEEAAAAHPPAYEALFFLHRLAVLRDPSRGFAYTAPLQRLEKAARERGDGDTPYSRIPEAVKALRSEDWAACLSAVEAIEAGGLRVPLTLMFRGQARRGLGDMKGALADFQEAIALDPTNAGAHFLRGSALAVERRWREAEASYTRGLDSAPESPRMLVNRSNLRGRLGDLEGARRDLRQAARLDPKYATPHYNLGVLEEKARRWEAAELALNRALILDPERFEAWTKRARVRLRLGKGAAALEDAERGVKLAPESSEAYFARAMAREVQGKAAESLEDLDKALEIEPSYIDALFRRAALLYNFGRFSESQRDLRRMLAAEPEHKQAAQARAWLDQLDERLGGG